MSHDAVVFIIFSASAVMLLLIITIMHAYYSALKIQSGEGALLYLSLLNLKSRNMGLKKPLEKLEWATPYIDGQKSWDELSTSNICRVALWHILKPQKKINRDDFYELWDNAVKELPVEIAEDFDKLMVYLLLGTTLDSFTSFVVIFVLSVGIALLTLNFKLLRGIFTLGVDGLSLFSKFSRSRLSNVIMQVNSIA